MDNLLHSLVLGISATVLLVAVPVGQAFAQGSRGNIEQTVVSVSGTGIASAFALATMAAAAQLKLDREQVAASSIPQGGEEDLKVMSTGGFEGTYNLLAPVFEKTSGAHLSAVWGPSMGTTPGAIPGRLAQGEKADVLILARQGLDDLAKKGIVVPDSETDLTRSRIWMAVKAGAPKPDISTVDAFRKTLLAARSVAYSDSASGAYIRNELFKKLGIEKEMAAKSKAIHAEPVGNAVARGDADIAFHQIGDLKAVPGLTIVGPIPEEVQSAIVYAAGIVATSPNKDTARALIHYLSSKNACAAMEQTNLEPVACPSNAR